MCSRYMTKAGFPEGVAHTLRHSFATNSQASGLSIYETNILMRQSSIGMTERYSHLVPDQIYFPRFRVPPHLLKFVD